MNTTTRKNLTDKYRTSHPIAGEYIFFSRTHGTFSSIDHVLGHKTSFNKSEKTEIKPYVFSDLNRIKLEINSRKKTGKLTNL